MKEMMSEGKREMPLTIPFHPLLKGEETVMMIIRLGNIFPLSHFRLISQISPIKKAYAYECVCVCVYVCLADAILGFLKKAQNHGPRLCFVFLASAHLPWKICHHSCYFPIFSLFSHSCHFRTPTTCLTFGF